jgi:hypothetical protein
VERTRSRVSPTKRARDAEDGEGDGLTHTPSKGIRSRS